jgi:outer membrane protein assembly factor BamB
MGGEEEAASPGPTTSAPPPLPQVTTTDPEPPEAEPDPALVRVVDGDTGERVENAVVTAAAARARTNAWGRAAVDVGKRKRTLFRVNARGYDEERVRTNVRRKEPLVVEIYRPRYQWTMYGANLARTQVHPAIDLRPPFRQVWSRPLGSLIEFPAVVWKGVGYISNLQGYVHAIDLDDGKILWRTRIGSLMAASPGLAPERNELIVPTMSPGELVVLNMKTGKRKWSYPSGRAEPSAAIRDGVAYLAAANGNVYAMSLETKRPRWIYRGGVKITSSVAVKGNHLYFGDYAGRVVCLNAKTGRTIWVGSAGSRVYGTVAVANGRVFAPSVFSGLSALSAKSGRLLWRNSVGSYLYSSPAVYKGRVYYGSYGRTVYSASARSGRVFWARSVAGSISGAIQIVGGVAYSASFGNQTKGWHWRTGREVFSFPHGRYVAVSGNAGKILVHGIRRMFAFVPKKNR